MKLLDKNLKFLVKTLSAGQYSSFIIGKLNRTFVIHKGNNMIYLGVTFFCIEN